MSKSIASILALSGNQSAAVAVASADLHKAIFHLCHAGQATPLSDTFADLPNRGKAAKIRAVVQDFWNQAIIYREACKADGKLDKSGRYVGLQAVNLPFTLGMVSEALTVAVATVKKAAVDNGEEKPLTPIQKAKAETEAATVEAEKATATAKAAQTELEKAEALIEALKVENAALKAELTALLAVAVPVPVATPQARARGRGRQALAA